MFCVMQESNSNEGDTYEPRHSSLREFLVQFVHHRLEVIIKRAKYDLKRAKSDLHCEGLLKALSMIDEVVAIIRNPKQQISWEKQI